MRFLCDKCHAKYQIADEKAAGRTVRMKCRKCGHLIEVAASVTETSVSAGVTMADDLVVAVRDDAHSRPAAGHIGHAQPVAPRPRPSAPRPHVGGGAMPGAARATASLANRDSSKGGATASSASAGLAGAFSKAVAAPAEEAPSAMSTAVAVLSGSNLDEWYVGINGVPVGPVRLSELRRKAQQKLIDEESLVWREGFEEWVPLRTFPELTAMLKEAAATARTSLTPPPPARSASSPKPVSPAKTSASIGSSRGIPIAGRSSTAVEPAPHAPASPAGASPASASTAAVVPSVRGSTPASAARTSTPAPSVREPTAAPAPARSPLGASAVQPLASTTAATKSLTPAAPGLRSNVVPIGSRRADRPTPVPPRPAEEFAKQFELGFDTRALDRLNAKTGRERLQDPTAGRAAEAPLPPDAESEPTVVAPIAAASPASPLVAESPAPGSLGAAVVTEAEKGQRSHATEHESKGERRRHRNVPFAAKLVPILIGVLGGMVLMLVIRPESQAPNPSASVVPTPHPPLVAASQHRPEKAAEKPAEANDDTTTTIGPIELSAVAPAKGPGGGRQKGENSPGPTGQGAGVSAASTNSLSSLGGLAAGPAINAASGSGGTGGPLTEGDISRVVQGRRAFVSRRCWEPALAAKPPSLPSTAKVNVTLSIAADGHVSEASASGGDGFPGLAGCVQGQVRSWTFPRNDGQSSIKIPFVFAGQ